jgi:acetyl-CoA carboxylase biotin carboxyl carrier protein
LSDKKRSKKAAVPETAGDAGPMDLAHLQKLVKLMQDNDLNTVELQDGARRVMLKRGPAEATMPMAGPTALPSAASTGTAAESANLTEIKSPMVGTFYTATSPDAKPLVTVGTEITEETDVCVIEAMKVFNNVKADCRGTIAKILVGNGQAVEFGQVLFLVRP